MPCRMFWKTIHESHIHVITCSPELYRTLHAALKGTGRPFFGFYQNPLRPEAGWTRDLYFLDYHITRAIEKHTPMIFHEEDDFYFMNLTGLRKELDSLDTEEIK